MNRKLLTMAVAGLLSVAGLSAQEPQLKWVTSQDGMGLEIPQAIKASSDGYVFLMNNFASSDKETSYDPEAAKSLLEEAGWMEGKDGWKKICKAADATRCTADKR